MRTIKLDLPARLVRFVLRQCKRHKMTKGEFITFALKKKTREDFPGMDITLPENALWRYTTKEQRALRRGNG